MFFPVASRGDPHVGLEVLREGTLIAESVVESDFADLASVWHSGNREIRLTASGVTAMPRYDYRCNDCGEQFEVVQSFDEPTLTACPHCGQQGLRKLFGNVGVVFKGSGLYMAPVA